jgi:hypothetical protein
LCRRALLGASAAAFPDLAGFSNIQLFAILSGMAVFYSVLAAVVFRRCDFVARERGMIDMVSNY